MRESPFTGQAVDFLRITDEDNVSYVVSQNPVGGFKSTLLRSFGEYDALFVAFGLRNDFL